jgi:pimeloyl-ACP methyl ester carboxylesterase
MRRSAFLLLLAAALVPRTARGETVANTVPRALVVVLDGAGDLKGCSTAFTKGKAAYKLPVDIEVFPWSHGHLKILKDQVDERHAKLKGKELAERLLALRRRDPDRPLILVSYSAGCSVALAAAGHLPPDAIDRCILLMPSVSRRYDLRPTLRATRLGVDVYGSDKDKWALGLAVRWVGTADELHDAEAAGRLGFTPVIERAGDTELYLKLRHHFWKPADAKLGHDGRHHGIHALPFLDKYVFPLLRGGE